MDGGTTFRVGSCLLEIEGISPGGTTTGNSLLDQPSWHSGGFIWVTKVYPNTSAVSQKRINTSFISLQLNGIPYNQTVSSTMVACDDNAWGPTVPPGCRGGFDFTSVFEDTVLAIIPCAISILIAVAWLYRSRECPRKVRSYGGFWPKAIIITLSSILQLAFLVVWAVKLPRPSRTALPAAMIELIATVIMGLVSYTDHFKTLQPSTILCLYLPLNILLGIPHVRTLWLMQLQLPLAPVLTACLSAKIIWLVLEARHKHILLEEYEDVTEEAVAGILSQCVFGWLLPFIIRGSRKDILSRDLLHLDTELRSLRVHDMFKVNWRLSNESEQPNILAWCLLKTFKWQLLRAVLPRLSLLAFTVLQPIIIERLVDYAGTSDDIHERATGLGLIAAVALVYGGTAVRETKHEGLQAMKS
jgi:ATP-binding cassette subfamily C (CFTR/MRP) protein 1